METSETTTSPSYGTPEITGRIVRYHRGEISFAHLYDELTQHDYAKPAHWEAKGSEAEIESAFGTEPGTVDELYAAKSRGLLSTVELEAILSGILRAHGA